MSSSALPFALDVYACIQIELGVLPRPGENLGVAEFCQMARYVQRDKGYMSTREYRHWSKVKAKSKWRDSKLKDGVQYAGWRQGFYCTD